MIGVLGRFDADDLEAAILGRVLRHQLGRRFPDTEVRFFAPYGWERPSRLDGGEPAEPLGEWSHQRAVDLGARLDLALVVPSPAEAPRDPRDRWLEPGGFDETVVPVEVVPVEPHLALLADELLPRFVFEKRLAYLRLVGAWPELGPVHVVESAGRLMAAESMLPADLSVEDTLAVLAVAETAELTSPSLVAVRRAFHPDDATTAERARLDLWFDAVAAALEKATTGTAVDRARAAEQRMAELEARLAALTVAHEARGRRLVEERLVFADHVDALQREFGVTHVEVMRARARAERDAARAELESTLRRRADELRAAADVELTMIKMTRSWRWTRPFRALARRVPRWRRSP